MNDEYKGLKGINKEEKETKINNKNIIIPEDQKIIKQININEKIINKKEEPRLNDIDNEKNKKENDIKEIFNNEIKEKSIQKQKSR